MKPSTARRRPRYWLRRLMVLAVILLPVLAWQGWAFMHSLPVKAESAAPRLVAGKPAYVAIMGVDERKDDQGRSDTLLLVRVDPAANRMDLVNIPRDTRVQLDGNMQKINAAYTAGGPSRVTTEVASLLGIEKPYYVTVNFKAFEELVDLVNGVPMTLERDYYYEDPYQDLVIDLKAGQQILHGPQALHFVRLRYDGVTNSDIARIERQQQFLAAFKARIPSSWSKVPSMLKIMRSYVKTNIPEGDQLTLARHLWDARDNLHMQTLPGTFSDDERGDWLLDTPAWKEVTRAWSNP